MDQLKVAEFIAKLKSKLNDVDGIEDAISILEKQKINGKRAKSLTTENYYTLGIAFGDAMEIEEAVKEIEKDMENEPGPTTTGVPPLITVEEISDPATSANDQLDSESRGKTGKSNLVSDTNDKLQEKLDWSLWSCKGSSKGNDNNGRPNKSSSNFSETKNCFDKRSESRDSFFRKKKSEELSSDKYFNSEYDNGMDGFMESPLNKSSDCGSNLGSQKDDRTESSVDKSSDSESNDDSQKDNKKFECLKEYFKASDWKEMVTYDKSAYLKQYHSYQRLLKMAHELGKASESVRKPAFMMPDNASPPTKKVSASMKKKKDKEKKKEGEKKECKEKKTDDQEKKTDDQEKKTDDKEKKKDDKEKKKDDKEKKKDDKEKKKDDKEKKKDDKEKKKEDKGKQEENKENNVSKRKGNQSKRVPFVKKRKVSKIHCHGPCDMPESEYVESLLEYDVEAVLEDAGSKLKDVRDALSKDGIVFDNQRRLMIRTLTKYLFFESVEDPKDVTQLHKEGLAASICKVWPKFKDESTTRYSWHILFHRQTNSGFIANVVQSIYRTLDDSQKRRPRKEKPEKSKPTSASTSGADFDPEDHKWISLLVATRLNKNEIIEGMQDSFSDRRNWITAKSPSITEILQHYPHLMSYRGEVLSIEFSKMEPGKSSMLIKEFGALCANVKKICSLEELEDFDCEELQVLIALSVLLPSPNILRNRKRSLERAKAVAEDIITIFTRGSDVQSVVAAKRKAASGKPVQPYLLASVPDRAIVKLFVVCDSNLIEVEGTSFLTGLDLLFKSFFVFNVEYPLGWTFVFQFLEQGIFKINSEAMSISGKELLKRLSSVNTR